MRRAGPRSRLAATVEAGARSAPFPWPPGWPHGQAGTPGRRTTNRAWRILAISILGAIALILIVFQYQFRELEADAAAHLYRLFTPVLAASRAPIIWFGLGAPGRTG